MDIVVGSGLGALCALASACTWAIITLLVRSLCPPLNAVVVNAIRTTVSGILLLAWIVLGGNADRLLAMSSGAFALLALSIIVATGIGDTVFFETSRRLGLARTMTISMTYPLFAAVMAAAFLGEALTARLAAGAVLVLGGVALIVTSRGTDPVPDRAWLGVAAALFTAVAWAVSTILVKPPLEHVDVVTAQAIRLPVAGAFLWATPWARGATDRLRDGGSAILWRLAMVSVLTVLSSVLWVTGIKYAGVGIGTVLASTAPMFAIPLGVVFLGERLPRAAILGSVVTVAGIAVLRL